MQTNVTRSVFCLLSCFKLMLRKTENVAEQGHKSSPMARYLPCCYSSDLQTFKKSIKYTISKVQVHYFDVSRIN